MTIMTWFQKKEALPMATHAKGIPDGSGKAIHMDAPIVKAWKNSSNYIKGSYYIVIVSLILMIGGYRQLRHSHASIWLTCHAQSCTLDVSPPSSRKTTTITFARSKLKQSEAIKVTKDNVLVGPASYNTANVNPRDEMGMNPRERGKYKKKKKYGDNRGPDANGHYDSYTIRLTPEDHDIMDDKGNLEKNWNALKKFSTVTNEGDYIVSLRQFNLGTSRRSTRTMVNRIDSYIKQRRHKLNIKENSSMSWKGILAMVFGLFALLLDLLIGQFWEEEHYHKTGGPGARRRHAEQQRKKQQQHRQRQQQRQHQQPRYSGYPSSQRAQSEYTVKSGSSSSARPMTTARGGTAASVTRRKGY